MSRQPQRSGFRRSSGGSFARHAACGGLPLSPAATASRKPSCQVARPRGEGIARLQPNAMVVSRRSQNHLGCKMRNRRLVTFLFLAFIISPTAAFADCPGRIAQQTVQKLNAKGRHIQPSQVDCKKNGMKGQNVMLISVGNELVGSCLRRMCSWQP
jgi:hypothetical protein